MICMETYLTLRSQKIGRGVTRTVEMSGYPFLSLWKMALDQMEKSEAAVPTSAMFVWKKDTALLLM